MAALVKVIDEVVGIHDGNSAAGAGGLYDPWGKITHTVTDEGVTLVWTKGFPPFVRKAIWTDEVS